MPWCCTTCMRATMRCPVRIRQYYSFDPELSMPVVPHVSYLKLSSSAGPCKTEQAKERFVCFRYASMIITIEVELLTPPLFSLRVFKAVSIGFGPNDRAIRSSVSRCNPKYNSLRRLSWEAAHLLSRIPQFGPHGLRIQVPNDYPGTQHAIQHGQCTLNPHIGSPPPCAAALSAYYRLPTLEFCTKLLCSRRKLQYVAKNDSWDD